MTLNSFGRPADAIPVLEARHGDLPTRLAAWPRTQHPAVVFAAVACVGYLAVAALAVALGALIVSVLVPDLGLGAEEHVNAWLAAHRSSSLDTASAVGSAMGDVPAIPAFLAAAALAMLWLRQFRAVAFLVGAILIEVATYRAASLLVHRDRPGVTHLDHLPLNQSFPSGHVAASVVVYGALALLLTSIFRRRWVSAVCWSLAFALPAIVAWSRMYRGMHHPSDVCAGALVGAGALVVALMATRASGQAVRDRRRAPAPPPRVGART